MIQIHWQPTTQQLRQFGLAAMVALPLAGWLFSGRPSLPGAWSGPQQGVVIGLALAGGMLGLAGLLRPRMLRPVYLVATLLAFPIGLVLGELVMLALYLLVFAPVAMLFRILRRDALQRRLDRDARSYWVLRPEPRDVRSYFRQS